MARPMPRLEFMYDHGTGAQRRGYLIHCCKCACRDLLNTSMFRTPPSWEFYLKHFKRLGWELGSTPQKDTCPKCIDAIRFAKRQKRHGAAALPLPTTPARRLPANVLPLHPVEPIRIYGMTVPELAQLAETFTRKGVPRTPEAILRRLAELRAQIAFLRGEYAAAEKERAMLETRLKGRTVLRLPKTAAAR